MQTKDLMSGYMHVRTHNILSTKYSFIQLEQNAMRCNKSNRCPYNCIQ